MVNRQITIGFPQQLVQMYSQNGYQVCFGIMMGDNPTVNVIAKADTIESRVTIVWNDDYKIAATKEGFMNGVKVQVNTDPISILPGQVYTLPATWVNGSITKESLPGKSIKMVNNTAGEAAAVLYTRINGQELPFYVSNPPIEPKGSQLLIEREFAALWLQRNAETGNMVSADNEEMFPIDVSGRTTVNVTCDGGRFVTD